MAMRAPEPDVQVRAVSRNEGCTLFDRAARYYLNMSGADFLAAWDAGTFSGDNRPGVRELAILLPFVR